MTHVYLYTAAKTHSTLSVCFLEAAAKESRSAHVVFCKENRLHGNRSGLIVLWNVYQDVSGPGQTGGWTWTSTGIWIWSSSNEVWTGSELTLPLPWRPLWRAPPRPTGGWCNQESLSSLPPEGGQHKTEDSTTLPSSIRAKRAASLWGPQVCEPIGRD